MPSFDLALPAFLLHNGSAVVAMRGRSGASALTLTTGTLAVYAPDGSAHSTPSVTVASNVASATVALSSAAALGRGWRLDWTLGDGTSTWRVSQAAIAARLGAPQLPVSTQDLQRLHPELLGVYPTGQTSWDPQIDQAWAEVLSTLSQRSSVSVDAVTDPSLLYPLVLRRSLACAMRIAMTGSAGGKAQLLSETYQTEYETMLAAASLPVDEDRDGVADRRAMAASASWPPAGGERF